MNTILTKLVNEMPKSTYPRRTYSLARMTCAVDYREHLPSLGCPKGNIATLLVIKVAPFTGAAANPMPILHAPLSVLGERSGTAMETPDWGLRGGGRGKPICSETTTHPPLACGLHFGCEATSEKAKRFKVLRPSFEIFYDTIETYGISARSL